jgi:hypothetical protein
MAMRALPCNLLLQYAYICIGCSEMLMFGIASKVGLHLVTIAHFLEISNTLVVVYHQNIYLWVPSSTSGMRVVLLACNRLL